MNQREKVSIRKRLLESSIWAYSERFQVNYSPRGRVAARDGAIGFLKKRMLVFFRGFEIERCDFLDGVLLGRGVILRNKSDGYALPNKGRGLWVRLRAVCLRGGSCGGGGRASVGLMRLTSGGCSASTTRPTR